MSSGVYLRVSAAILLAAAASIAIRGDTDATRFAIIGDRTGEAQFGVYEQVWKEAAAEHPAFVLSVGDTIEGMHDRTAESEWQQVDRILKPYRRYPLCPVPGNHDIWSTESEQLYRKHTGRPPHYSFDHGPAHFTMLDNSRSDELSSEELAFLEQDLKAHASQPVKFIVSHRPSWIMPVALRNTTFRLHQLARQYGAQYVIAGHVHQMLRFELEGVTYISMPSSGGHLRASKAYKDGWFFAHALIDVRGTDIDFRIEEAKPPHGEGRVTRPADWGMLGLVDHRAAGGSVSVGIPAR